MGYDLMDEWAPDYRSMTAPPPQVAATLEGLTFMSGSVERSRITLSGWDGWMNGSDSRVDDGQWENADGGITTDVFFTGRSIRLEGLIIERTTRSLWERMEELGTVLTRPRWGWLTVEEGLLGGLTRQIYVRRARRPMVTPVSSRIATYTLELVSAEYPRLAPDGFSTVIPAGGVELMNEGDWPAALGGTIVGPRTNPGFSWPGGAWKYTGSVAAGQTLFLDFQRRLVRDPATTAHSRALAQGTWLALPPGRTTVSSTGTGSGSQTLSGRSSWS